MIKGLKGDENDPKGLIFESYRIEDIDKSQCRVIFLDWALSLPDGMDTHAGIRALLAQYETDAPDHPMTAVLNEGLSNMATPRRRGGWRSRQRN